MRLLLLALSLCLTTGCSTLTTSQQHNPAGAPSGFAGGYYGTLYQAHSSARNADDALAIAAHAYHQGDRDYSLYEYLHALEFDSESNLALYWIARIHREQGNDDLATAAIDKALLLDPNDPYALQEQGLLALRQQNYPLAQQRLQQALDTLQQTDASADPRHSQITLYNALGILADLRQEHKTARQHFRKALATAPRSALLHNSLAYSYYLNGDWDKAAASFKQSIALDRQYAPAWRNLGLLYTRMGRYEEALAAFEQVEGPAQASNEVGYICLLEGRLDMARSFFQSALDQAPNHYPVAQQNLNRVNQLARLRQYQTSH